MKKITFGFFLCLFVASMFGAKDRDFEDVMNERVNKAIKHITDSIHAQASFKDTLIGNNRELIVPAIKAQAAEIQTLRNQHKQDSSIIAFYREVTGQNPTLIHKRTFAKCK